MAHLVLALPVAALADGAGSLGQAAMLRLRHRKTVIRHYALFLPSILILQAAGGLRYIASGPFFYYTLIGLRMPKWSLAGHLPALFHRARQALNQPQRSSR